MTPTVIVFAVVIVLIAFRVYRQTREQRWSLVAMWVPAVIVLALSIVVVTIDARASALAPLAAIAGLAVGAAIGLYQGTHTTVRVEKNTRSLYVKISPIGTLIFVGVLALRFALRFATGGFAAPQSPHAGASIPALSPIAAITSSALLALAAGMVIGLRLYMLRRYAETA